jgi:hypothetical protein
MNTGNSGLEQLEKTFLALHAKNLSFKYARTLETTLNSWRESTVSQAVLWDALERHHVPKMTRSGRHAATIDFFMQASVLLPVQNV